MESIQNTVQSYALALLTLVGKRPGADDPKKEDQPFGWAKRVETQKSIYTQSAHKLFHALIEHSPSPEKVAQGFLNELLNCENDTVVNLGDAVSTLCDPFYVKYCAQVANLDNDRSISPDDWAAEVDNELLQNGGTITSITKLANFYLSNLIIACRVLCNISWL